MKIKYEVKTSVGNMLFHVCSETGKVFVETKEDSFSIDLDDAEILFKSIDYNLRVFKEEEKRRNSSFKRLMKKLWPNTES